MSGNNLWIPQHDPKDPRPLVVPINIWNPLKQHFYDLKMYDMRNADSYEQMRQMRRTYSYAIPSNEFHKVIGVLCGDKIVEIGAGTGYWAKYLSQFGFDILAFDQIEGRSQYCDDIYYYHVDLGGPEVLSWTSDRTLLLCWPPYDTSFAYDCLKAYTGNYVISVGEGYGGCTGDDKFHNLLEEEWEVIHGNYDCLNFYGIHSSEYIYQRKTSTKNDDVTQLSEEEIY